MMEVLFYLLQMMLHRSPTSTCSLQNPMHLCMSSFLLPVEQCKTHTQTHTHTLPTLLLTAVCSETIESQRCNLSSEPLIELFYVVELMQLFFSGQ